MFILTYIWCLYALFFVCMCCYGMRDKYVYESSYTDIHRFLQTYNSRVRPRSPHSHPFHHKLLSSWHTFHWYSGRTLKTVLISTLSYKGKQPIHASSIVMCTLIILFTLQKQLLVLCKWHVHILSHVQACKLDFVSVVSETINIHIHDVI